MDKVTIGKVSATESSPTTTDKFVFWLRDDEIVAPFDIVASPNLKKSTTYGQIVEMAYVSDSPSHIGNYVASDFGSTEEVANTPRLGTTFVTCDVLANNRDVYMPLHEGRPIHLADEEGVREALGLEQIEEKDRIPAGFLTLSNGISVEVSYDWRFLIGPEGAHLNVSGISGLAAKTSYVTFLMRAIQQRSTDTAMIILNVKGEDLLHLHEPNPNLSKHDKEAWKKCQLEPTPFESVQYYFPFLDSRDTGYADTACDKETRDNLLGSEQAFNYVYTFEQDKGKVDLLFSNVDDPALTIDSILDEIVHGAEFQQVTTWQQLLDKVHEKMQGGQTSKDKAIHTMSWRRFYRLLKLHLGKPGSLYQSSLSSVKEKHEERLEEKIAGIRAGEAYVVDIAHLEEQEQCLVFEDIIKTVYDMKLGGTDRKDVPARVIIFVDELNKYAPSSIKSSPIISNLLEITERGRSLGVILFSAQQFKSFVHDRVKGNCGTHVFGRTNVTEVAKADYRSIPNSYTHMMTRLPQGGLIVQHPPYPRLLRVNFPRPCYLQPK